MSAQKQFAELAAQIVDEALRRDPVGATWMGDHRFDSDLPDHSEAADRDQVHVIDDYLTRLDAIDDVELPIDDLVDLEILRSRLMRSRFELEELRSAEWNPLVWNPGTALHLLASREFASRDERAHSMVGRVEAIPDFLADGRHRLRDMPAIHAETAIAQLNGTVGLIDGPARDLVGDHPCLAPARKAVEEFAAWLGEQPAHRDPRLGQRDYSAALWHALDDDISAQDVLSDAEHHLDRVSEFMQEAAASYLQMSSAGQDDVRQALDEIARRNVVTDQTVLQIVDEAVTRTAAFVRDHSIVSLPDVEVRVIEMPEIHRGVAVAYCDAPGPLETAAVPTFVAVSPTPHGWSDERIESFYREYNAVQLHDLTIHEAMPGHVLQLAYARSSPPASTVRKLGMSGVFVEGWAVYAEELMFERGYAPDDSSASRWALRLQQLKMQAQGPSIADDLRVMHSGWDDAAIHGLMLEHGSPPPRHLRTLIGL